LLYLHLIHCTQSEISKDICSFIQFISSSLWVQLLACKKIMPRRVACRHSSYFGNALQVLSNCHGSLRSEGSWLASALCGDGNEITLHPYHHHCMKVRVNYYGNIVKKVAAILTRTVTRDIWLCFLITKPASGDFTQAQSWWFVEK